MAIGEQHHISGYLHIQLRNPEGRVIEDMRVKNLITTAGKDLLAQMFSGISSGTPRLTIAVGDSNEPATPGDTKLGSKKDEAEASTLEPRIVEEEGVKKVVATVSATLPQLPPNSEQALTEAGIQFHITGKEPVLYNRVVFPVITRRSNLEMDMTWEVSF